MKKSSITVGLCLIGVLAIAGGLLYWKNFRGIGPAIQPPPDDIVELLETEETTSNDTQESMSEQKVGNMPLSLPENFSISIFASGTPGARVLAIDPAGNLLVSSSETGKIFAMPDTNGGHKADEVKTIASGLNGPHGLAFNCPDEVNCKLYVAESDKISGYDYKNLTLTNKQKIVDLNEGGRHHTATLLYGAPGYENKLLIASGSSCDVCHEEDWRRAKILITNLDGSEFREFAKGLRNAVFLTLHPVTGKIWATEMGRDNLGDNLPPDEINIIEDGKNYGWPICYGKNIHDDAFDKNVYIRNPCMEPYETPSHIDIQAHSAPLGLAFAPEEGWPEDYWHNLFVAYHGSWNRSEPTGYKIVRYILDDQGQYLGQVDFITGWLSGSGALGRPVDLLVQPGGTMYISDDKAGVVYQVALKNPAY